MFHTFAIILEASRGYPGADCVALSEYADLDTRWIVLSGKRGVPKESILCFDFKTILGATFSFRLHRPARSRTTLEKTLSVRRVLVIVRALELMALLQ